MSPAARSLASRFLTLPLLLIALAIGACGDDDGGTPDARGADGPRLDAAPGVDARVFDARPVVDARPIDGEPLGPVDDCMDVAASDCFSNYDCQEAERCQDIGFEGSPVPCCVTGARGTVQAGQPCTEATGEETCASAICIAGDTSTLCSKKCLTEVDCPANMQSCMSIAFSTTTDKFCFPTE